MKLIMHCITNSEENYTLKILKPRAYFALEKLKKRELGEKDNDKIPNRTDEKEVLKPKNIF